MTDQRWRQLMSPLHRSNHAPTCYMQHPENNAECDCGLMKKYKLTPQEISEGWHWCYDWDGLLVGPGMDECTHCGCLSVNSSSSSN